MTVAEWCGIGAEWIYGRCRVVWYRRRVDFIYDRCRVVWYRLGVDI